MPNFDQTIALVESDKQGLGTKPSQPATGSIKVVDYGTTLDRGIDVLFTDCPLVMTYNGTVNGGAGSQVLYTLPKGLTALKSAQGSLTITSGTQFGSTAALTISVGTVAIGSVSVGTTTTVNIIASTAATFTANTSSPTPKITDTESGDTFDGRTTANSFYLNCAVAPAGISATGTLTLNGRLSIDWHNGGGLTSRTT